MERHQNAAAPQADGEQDSEFLCVHTEYWTPIVFNGPLTPHTDNMILKLECDASEITSLV